MVQFFLDLKMQSTHCEKNCPIQIFAKFLRSKNGEIEKIFGFLYSLFRDHIRKENLMK